MNDRANINHSDRLVTAFSKLSAAELQALSEHFRYTSSDNTDEIETDVTIELGLAIRRALPGRYSIFRKLNDDPDFWKEHHSDFQDFSRDLPHEPAIIAAALAIRPTEAWEMSVVEAWSWVYRHAALLDVYIDDFAEWCEHQDPESSRAAVTEALMSPNCAAPALATDISTSPNAANRNA